MKGSEGTDVQAFRNRLAVIIGAAYGLGREFAQAGRRGKDVDVGCDSVGGAVSKSALREMAGAVSRSIDGLS